LLLFLQIQLLLQKHFGSFQQLYLLSQSVSLSFGSLLLFLLHLFYFLFKLQHYLLVSRLQLQNFKRAFIQIAKSLHSQTQISQYLLILFNLQDMHNFFQYTLLSFPFAVVLDVFSQNFTDFLIFEHLG